MYAVLRLIDVAEFRPRAPFRRTELLIAPPSARSWLSGSSPGVLVAVALSVLALLGRVARPHDPIQGFVPELAGCTTSTTTQTQQ